MGFPASCFLGVALAVVDVFFGGAAFLVEVVLVAVVVCVALDHDPEN